MTKGKTLALDHLAGDPPPHFSPASEWVPWLRATLPLPAAKDGSHLLPGVVRWAYSLNEGDLLAVSPGLMDSSCRFESYARSLRNAAEECLDPRPWIEELLRLPLAAVGPRGALRLPEEAQAVLAGGKVLLRAESELPWHFEFHLERVARRRSPSKLSLVMAYLLPVLPGLQAMLPQDVVWALGLAAGDRLACQEHLGEARFEPWERAEPPKGRSVVELGPGGLLPLPDSWRFPWVSKVRLQVRLKGTPSTRATLQVTPWMVLE
jgi:hypothetical protein